MLRRWSGNCRSAAPDACGRSGASSTNSRQASLRCDAENSGQVAVHAQWLFSSGHEPELCFRNAGSP